MLKLSSSNLRFPKGVDLNSTIKVSFTLVELIRHMELQHRRINKFIEEGYELMLKAIHLQ